jgi:hypothetical protein
VGAETIADLDSLPHRITRNLKAFTPYCTGEAGVLSERDT